MTRVRVGIIGLGAIAQAIHLPNLNRLWDRFEIAHVCDLSRELTDAIADAIGGRVRRSTDIRAVLENPGLDAVLILTSGPHAPATRAALEAGKHVFVEKPLCLTAREAGEIEAAARSADRVVQVGYMKAHDPIIPLAQEAARSIDDLRLVRATVLHPTEKAQQRHLMFRGSNDVPPEAVSASLAYEADLTRQAIGELPPGYGWLYREVAIGSIVHQVALIRTLLGKLPADLMHVEAWPGALVTAGSLDDGPVPPSILAVGDLGSGCLLEIAWMWLPVYPEYVERYELFGPNARLRLDLPTAYAQDQHARLRVEKLQAGQPQATLRAGDHRSGFQAELEAFHAAVTGGTPHPSDAASATSDVRFLQRLIAALAIRDGLQPGGEAAASGVPIPAMG